MESPSATRRGRIVWWVLCPALLLLINYLIVAKMFTISYTAYMESNEGTFIAIARQIASGKFEFGWWPLWDLGIPYQNTYLPLLHLLVGGVGWATGSEIPLTFHRVCALFYVIAPAAVYAMAYTMTKRPGASLLAGLTFSLISPANFLLPMVVRDLGSVRFLRRLNILDFYGEGPYTAALAMLPVAILFLYLAISRRSFWTCTLAGIACGLTVLFNAFGAVMLVIVCVCLLATVQTERFFRNALLLACIGALAYAWISPLFPPSVIADIRRNSPTVDGDYRFTMRSAMGVAVIAVGFLITWWLTRRFEPAERFFALMALITSGIVLLGFHARVFVVPQPTRYQGVMDMALSLAVAFGGVKLIRDVWPRLRVPALVAVAVVAALQLRTSMIYGQINIRGGEVTETAAYQIAKWADANLGGRRMMVSASHSFHFNAFTDTPQLHGGHDPMEPNDLMAAIVFQIYDGPDPVPSILWMKALGTHAIVVPGNDSTERYKPFKFPQKFDGYLPVRWKERGDTIYEVPLRSASLAHVVPDGALVRDKPTNGIDMAQVEAYVKALEDASLPEAPIRWDGWNHGEIAARVLPGQSLSLQFNHDPGWHASVGGQELPIRKDGLGFMVVSPKCEVGCSVSLVYDGGTERTATLWTSFGVMLGVLAMGLYKWRLASYPPFARN